MLACRLWCTGNPFKSEAANRPPTPAYNIASVRTRYYGIAGTPPWGPKEPGHAGKAASPQ